MTQMPQLVALFNGVGGGAAASVAVLELGHSGDPWVRLAVVFTMLVGAVSFAGSAVTVGKAAGTDQHPAAALPRHAGGDGAVLAGALTAGVLRRPHRGARLGRCGCWSWAWPPACCWCCRSAAPTCRS